MAVPNAHPMSKYHTLCYHQDANLEKEATLVGLGCSQLPSSAAVVNDDDEGMLFESVGDIMARLSGAKLRNDNFDDYLRCLSGLAYVADKHGVTEEQLHMWMERQDPMAAEADLATAYSMKPSTSEPLFFVTRALIDRFSKAKLSIALKASLKDKPKGPLVEHPVVRKWKPVEYDDLEKEVQNSSAAGVHVAMQGGMGCGKTHAVLKLAAEQCSERVLFITGRVNLAGEIEGRAKKAGFKHTYSYKRPDLFKRALLNKYPVMLIEARGSDPGNANFDDGTDDDVEDEAVEDDDNDNFMRFFDDDVRKAIDDSQGSPDIDEGNDAARPMPKMPKFFITCVNSMASMALAKVFSLDIKWDMVVIDEAETTMSNLYSAKLMGDTGTAVCDALFNTIGRTNFLMSIDAGHTEKLASCLHRQYICQYRMNNKDVAIDPMCVKCCYGQNSYAKERGPIFNECVELAYSLYPIKSDVKFGLMRTTRGSMCMEIVRRVAVLHENVCVSMALKKDAYALANILNTIRVDGKCIRVEVITGGAEQAHSVNELAQKANVLIYTSAISAGHSIDVKSRFSTLFAYFAFTVGQGAAQVTPSMEEQIQMCARLRHPTQKRMYFCLSTVHTAKLAGMADTRCYHTATRPHYTEKCDFLEHIKGLSSTDLVVILKAAIRKGFQGIKMLTTANMAKADIMAVYSLFGVIAFSKKLCKAAVMGRLAAENRHMEEVANRIGMGPGALKMLVYKAQPTAVWAYGGACSKRPMRPLNIDDLSLTVPQGAANAVQEFDVANTGRLAPIF